MYGLAGGGRSVITLAIRSQDVYVFIAEIGKGAAQHFSSPTKNQWQVGPFRWPPGASSECAKALRRASLF